LINRIVLGFILGGTLACMAFAQTKPPAPAGSAGNLGSIFKQPPVVTGPTPHLPDGTPDLSGTWQGGGSNSGDISKALKPGDSVSMQPWAEKVFKSRLAKDDPEVACLPTGIPRTAPYPWRMLQTPTHYFMLFEGNIHSFRQIFMDGRKHPDDPDPTWYGHSIGHWEGETLVVDTVGFNDKFWFDNLGHPHTEKLHTVERYTRTDLGNIRIEVTIDDPGTYTKPFTTVGRARLMLGDEIAEYICNENDPDKGHYVGPARLPTDGFLPTPETPAKR
jgi:hypothetical protein